MDMMYPHTVTFTTSDVTPGFGDLAEIPDEGLVQTMPPHYG